MKVEINVNQEVTIYPNQNGWIKMVELTKKSYDISFDEARKKVYAKRTSDNGYKDQLWCIIQDFHDMYYNGQNYLENAFMTIEKL